MESKIQQLKENFQKDIQSVKNTKQLEEAKVKYLGKKGPITALMQSLKDLPKEEKPAMGKLINLVKLEIEDSIEKTSAFLHKQELESKLAQESVDVTLPGKKPSTPHKHPITSIIDDMLAILSDMGFSIQYSPELDSEYYNYGGLNYPEDHPARDMQDTYYINEKMLLRSHNTNIQQRIMESHKPPIRIACPGKCYRNETISNRSHVIFHQIDVLYIDKHVTFSDLLATKKEFFSRLFGQEMKLRVRPSYFPFVEPGMEVDIHCTECGGSGCSLCKHSGWLEVSGAGMVHPNVLKEGGIDPNEYSGFAWGGGVERIYMLKHGISDIRLFVENDMRFLQQFS